MITGCPECDDLMEIKNDRTAMCPECEIKLCKWQIVQAQKRIEELKAKGAKSE